MPFLGQHLSFWELSQIASNYYFSKKIFRLNQFFCSIIAKDNHKILQLV